MYRRHVSRARALQHDGTEENRMHLFALLLIVLYKDSCVRCVYNWSYVSKLLFRMYNFEGRKLKISVVTPSHNRLKYLKDAVASVQYNVLAPIDVEFEHVIHDCGSTDGTKDYFIQNLPPEKIFYIKDRGDNTESTKDRQWIQATEDLRKDGQGELADNITFIRSEHKVPPSQARNICIQKATGQFICVLVCKNNSKKDY